VRCLRSLYDDEDGTEVIVVDNCGTSAELLNDFLRASVRLLEPGENLGFAGGCNAGAAVANGDILVFLNPDTVVAPGALRALAKRLEDPVVGVAMARVRLLDQPEVLNSGGTVVHFSGIAWAGRFGEPADEMKSVEDIAAASGAALAIRRETFMTLGGFTDAYFMYQEDVELSWRAHLTGLRVIVEPAADVYHEYEFGRNASKIALLERNRLLFILTTYSGRLLLLLSPALFGGEVAMLILAAREHWLGGKLAGWWWCARNVRWLLDHRRATQRLRRVSDREVSGFLSSQLDPKMVPLPSGLGVVNGFGKAYWALVRRAL
jgi:GT2 family glycosyltransferase